MKRNLLFIIVSLLLITGCASRGIIGNYNNNDNRQVNNNVGVTEDKTVGVFQFTNASLVFENEKSTFDVMVANTSDKSTSVSGFIVKFYKDDELIKSIDIVSTKTLAAHDATSIHFTYNYNLLDVTKVEYEIKK